MRKSEILIADRLATHFATTWRLGDDPPDIFLDHDGVETAVEITMLSPLNRAGTRSRISDDAAPCRVAKELSVELASIVPHDRLFIIGLPSPLNRARKTKASLSRHLVKMMATAGRSELESNVVIEGNSIEVKLSVPTGPRSDCVFGYVRPNGPGYDILEVTQKMLESSLTKKAEKCRDVLQTRPVWLALVSDYFFAELHNLQLAAKRTSVEIPFAKVLFIDGSGLVGLVSDYRSLR